MIRDTGPTLDETIEFVKGAHAGQTDKGGKPYWLHPLAVMRRLGPIATDDEKMVALLHDVIEDTRFEAIDLLIMGYSRRVVDAVVRLSRPRQEPRPTYLDWIRSIARSGDQLAIRVKIADNEENSDPERVVHLPPSERAITKRYARSLEILRAA